MRFEQRHELEAQRAAPERECLEQHGVGRGCLEGREQQPPAPLAIGLVDRHELAVAQRREARVGHADRRELDDANTARNAATDRRAAAHQMHVEAAVGERFGDQPRPHQVADAQQMLDVDEDGQRWAATARTRRAGCPTRSATRSVMMPRPFSIAEAPRSDGSG